MTNTEKIQSLKITRQELKKLVVRNKRQNIDHSDLNKKIISINRQLRDLTTIEFYKPKIQTT